MVTGKFKCSKCDRTFKMAGHLGRHMSAIHGTTPKSAARRTSGIQVRRGRPKGVTSRLGLRNMTLDELGEVIAEARSIGRAKIAELRTAYA